MYTTQPKKVEKKREAGNIWPVVGYLVILLIVLISVFVTNSVSSRTKKIESNQEVILQFLDRIKPNERSIPTPTVVKTISDKKTITQEEFEEFKKQHQKDIQRLRQDIKKLRGLL